MEHNAVQHLHSATLDSATSKSATLNSATLIVQYERVRHWYSATIK